MKHALSLPLVAALCGCSTLTLGTRQDVAFATPGADGALCTVKDRQGEVLATVTTPGSARLPKSRKEVHTTCQREGYRTATATVASSYSRRSMVQPLLGYLVDGVSGAMWNYPAKVNIDLTRLDSQPAANQPAWQRD
jgi:hypothetical protein